MTPPSDSLGHVVIAGGGVAGVETLLALHDRAEGRARVTLVAPERNFELKPLRTAEQFSVDHVRHYPLGEITDRFGAEHRYDRAQRVDPERRVLACASGDELAYDLLVLAVGGRPRPAYDEALTFGLERDRDAFHGVLTDLEQHDTRSVAFVVPPGVSWPLPLYELALMTARHVRSMGIDDAELTLVTHESAPLAVFGPQAAAAVAGLLDHAGVAFRPDAYAGVEQAGRITLVPAHEELSVDRVVALPVIRGPALAGVPSDEQGFVPTDGHGLVQGLDDVYAAGDAADFPVKQGGIACQQADVVASHIAARLGAPVEPEPFHPVLRGKLLTGEGAEYLRYDLHGGGGESRASELSLWFPPAKVSGRYLSEWLAWREGTRVAAPPVEHVQVEVALPADLRTRDDPFALESLGHLPRHRWRAFS